MNAPTTAMLELAVTMAGYFSQLMVQGFTRDEALQIVIAYQDALVGTLPLIPPPGED